MQHFSENSHCDRETQTENETHNDLCNEIACCGVVTFRSNQTQNKTSNGFLSHKLVSQSIRHEDKRNCYNVPRAYSRNHPRPVFETRGKMAKSSQKFGNCFETQLTVNRKEFDAPWHVTFSNMPPEQRLAVVRNYMQIQGVKQSMVARELNCSQATVSRAIGNKWSLVSPLFLEKIYRWYRKQKRKQCAHEQRENAITLISSYTPYPSLSKFA